LRARAVLAAAAIGIAAALGGCGSDPAPSATAPPAPAGSHFVGRTAGGLGASVDFGGFDEASRAVRRALAEAGEEAHVAIASLVNDGREPVAVPAFAAIDRLGERHGLATAASALRGLPGALARRARAALEEPAAVPAEGSAVVYLVLRGPAPGDLRELRMRVPGGRPADLERRGG
jgi:hypothetical protein